MTEHAQPDPKTWNCELTAKTFVPYDPVLTSYLSSKVEELERDQMILRKFKLRVIIGHKDDK